MCKGTAGQGGWWEGAGGRCWAKGGCPYPASMHPCSYPSGKAAQYCRTPFPTLCRSWTRLPARAAWRTLRAALCGETCWPTPPPLACTRRQAGWGKGRRRQTALQRTACCTVPPHTALGCSLLAAFATSHEQLLRSANPQEDETPVPAAALPGFRLVFDAVYTPLHTRLLKCAARGAAWVGGRG